MNDRSRCVSKSKYAVLRNVSKARVSQWIAEGKIEGDALVGDGRDAKINVAVADAQLARTLDIGNGDVLSRLASAQTANLAASKIIEETIVIYDAGLARLRDALDRLGDEREDVSILGANAAGGDLPDAGVLDGSAASAGGSGFDRVHSQNGD